MTITIEQLSKLAPLSKKQILVILACRWFDVRNVAVTRVQIVQSTSLHERNVNEALQKLEKRGIIRRQWNGRRFDPKASFFVKVNLDRIDPGSTGPTWIDSIQAPGSNRSSYTFTVKSDRSVTVRPSVRTRKIDPGDDGRTDGKFDVSERVKRAFVHYWPGVPEIALRDALKKLSPLQPSEDELVAFLKAASLGKHDAFNGADKADFRFGASMHATRFGTWRGKMSKVPAAKRVLRQNEESPRWDGAEEHIARAKKAIDGR